MLTDEIKQICNEIFVDYEILQFAVEGKDAVLKIRPKKSRKNISKISNSVVEAIAQADLG